MKISTWQEDQINLFSLFVYFFKFNSANTEYQLCSQTGARRYGSLVRLSHPEPSCHKVDVRASFLLQPLVQEHLSQLCYVMGETLQKCERPFTSRRTEKLHYNQPSSWGDKARQLPLQSFPSCYRQLQVQKTSEFHRVLTDHLF